MAAENDPLEIDIKINAAESANSVSDLKKSIRDLQDAAVAAGNAGDDALAAKYVNAAGQARDKIGDLNDTINATKGSADKLGAISNIGQSIAGGFAAAQGAAALFGASQEDIQQQLLKVQAATAILSGVQSTANIKEQLEIVKIIALREAQVVSTRLQTAAEEGGIVVRTAATAAQKALNLAMNNFPGLILIAAIAAVVVAFKNLGDTAEETAKKQVAANKLAMESLEERRKHDVEVLKALGKDTEAVEIENTRNRISRLQEEKARIMADEDLEDEVRKERLAEINEQWSEAIDELDILKATALTKDREAEQKAAEDHKKTSEDRIKQTEDEVKKRTEYHQQYLDALKKHDDDVQAQAQLHIEAINKYEADQLAQKQADADAALAIEEEAANLSFAKFADHKLKEKELADKALMEEQQRAQAKIQIATYSIQAIGSLGNILIKDSEKLAKFQKAVALVQIGIDTAKAISSVVAAAAANPLNATTAGIAGIVQMAAGIATVLANIAQAKKLLDSPTAPVTTLAGATATAPSPSTGGGGSSGRAPATGNIRVPNTQSSSPVMGRKEDCNCGPKIGTGSTTFDENGNPIVKAIVVESDITNTQARVQAIKSRSEF